MNRIPFSEDELKVIGKFPAPFPGRFFIEKDCHPDAHPVTVFSMGGHPKQGEAIYKLSRIALNK